MNTSYVSFHIMAQVCGIATQQTLNMTTLAKKTFYLEEQSLPDPHVQISNIHYYSLLYEPLPYTIERCSECGQTLIINKHL